MAHAKKDKKPKGVVIKSPDEDFDAVLAKINADMGEGTIIIADNLPTKFEHISTGVSALDIALGGGFVKQRVTELNGAESSLKSTITLCALRNHLLADDTNRAAYIDAEKTFDRNYATKLGVPLGRLAVINPDCGEQAVDTLMQLLRVSNDMLYVVDSIAALTPADELNNSVGASLPGAHPRLVGKMFRMLTAAIKRKMYDESLPGRTVLAINQLREKIGVMFGDPTTTPGGRAKDFYYSAKIRLHTSVGKAIIEKVTKNGITREIRAGQTVTFKVYKNKCGGSQFEEGEFTYFVKPHQHYTWFDFDNDEYLYRMATYFGLLKIGGGALSVQDPLASSGHYMYTGSCVARSKADILAHIHSNQKIMDALYAAVLSSTMAEEGIIDVSSLDVLSSSPEVEEIPAEPKRKKFKFSK